MSSFTKPLVVIKHSGRLWETGAQFSYHVGGKDSGDVITVPKGFKTDFASVPRIFWTIIPPDGKYTQAAVVHDYLYHTQTRSRKEADDIFLEAMEVLGVSWWKRNIMYQAVRKFAWMPWNAHAKRNKEKNK